MASYGFAPGGTAFDLAAANYVRLRKNTRILNTTSGLVPVPLMNLHDFITELANGTQAALPVDDLFLVSHGTHVGAMELPLDSTHTGLTYEEVDQVATAGTINIPSGVVNPRSLTGGGLPIPCTVHVVGCFCGAFDAYVRRFRTAFNMGTVGVSMPKNFDSFYAKDDGSAILKGALRFMLYDFRVGSPDAIVARKDLLDAFVAQPYRRIDSSVVPRSLYEKAIPKDFDTFGSRHPVNRVKLQPPIEGLKSIPVYGLYDNALEKVGPWTFANGGPGKLAPAADRRAFALSQLQGMSYFESTYPLPVYQRFGFSSLTDFVNGYNWLPMDVPLVAPSDKWIGWRHLYRCGDPIVDPSNDDRVLVCDYVSADGTIERLDLTNNPNLFARVYA